MALFDSNNVARYKLSSAGGGLLEDTGGAGNGLTLTNNGSVGYVTGHGGGANMDAGFNASTKRLSRADEAALRITGSITIAGWIKLVSANTVSCGIAGKFGTSGNYSYLLSVYGVTDDASYLRASLSENGTALQITTSTSALPTGTWCHVAVVYNQTDVRLYINGSLANTPLARTTAIYSGNAEFQIGHAAAFSSAYWLRGDAGDIYLSNRALSAAEIGELYALGDDFPSGTAATIAFTTDAATIAITGTVPEPTSVSIAFTTEDATVAVAGAVPEPTTASVAFTTDDTVVAATAALEYQATVAFTTGDAVISLAAENDVPTATIAFTTEDAAVAVTAELEYRAAVAFTTDNAVLAMAGVVPYLASVAVTTDDAVVSIMSSVAGSTENFSAVLRHKTTNSPITGLTTVYLKIRRESDGYRWDFNNNTFSLTPTTETLVLQEVDGVNQPGLYEGSVTTTGWSGWLAFEATYNDGAYTYYYPGEAYYFDGVRETGRQSVPSAEQNAAAVRTNLSAELGLLMDDAKSQGLVAGVPAVITATNRTAGSVSQTITEVGGTVTVTRV